jgi:hypothetical protein
MSANAWDGRRRVVSMAVGEPIGAAGNSNPGRPFVIENERQSRIALVLPDPVSAILARLGHLVATEPGRDPHDP